MRRGGPAPPPAPPAGGAGPPRRAGGSRRRSAGLSLEALELVHADRGLPPVEAHLDMRPGVRPDRSALGLERRALAGGALGPPFLEPQHELDVVPPAQGVLHQGDLVGPLAAEHRHPGRTRRGAKPDVHREPLGHREGGLGREGEDRAGLRREGVVAARRVPGLEVVGEDGPRHRRPGDERLAARRGHETQLEHRPRAAPAGLLAGVGGVHEDRAPLDHAGDLSHALDEARAEARQDRQDRHHDDDLEEAEAARPGGGGGGGRARGARVLHGRSLIGPSDAGRPRCSAGGPVPC
jgi:hypothetical protein